MSSSQVFAVPATRLIRMHQSLGRILRRCSRMLAAMACLGLLFSVAVSSTMNIMNTPKQALASQAFLLGYHIPTPEQDETSPSTSPSIERPRRDSDWDGMLAGGIWGSVIGQGVPMIGVIAGPIIGAGLGYAFDKKL